MTPKLLRLGYAIEFLIAMMATFTAWSEIGGQDALDLMPWGWKLGFSIGLCAAIVAYTSAIVTNDAFWTLRSAGWMTAILVVVAGMAAVTYYYALQVGANELDEPSNLSLVHAAGGYAELFT
jgi:Na+-transporting NADH:ubiquinone oxidoreductase subunit NqrB